MATPTLYDHVETGMDNVDRLGTLTVPLPGPNGTGAGNLLIAGVQCKSTYTISSVKDDLGNSFTAGPTNTGSGKRIAAFYLPNCAAGIRSIKVAYSGTGYGYPHVTLDQWYNVATSSPLDGSSINVASKSAGSITTTQAGDLIWHWGVDLSDNALGGAFNGSGTSITPGSGFTLTAADNQVGSCKQYQIQGSAGAINPTFTTTGSATWGSIAMAFKAAAGAGAGTAPPGGIRVFGTQTYSLMDPSDNFSQTTVLTSLQFPAIGNLIVLNFQSFLRRCSAITDNKSNSWTCRSGAFNPDWGFGYQNICYAPNATTGQTLGNISLSFSSGTGQGDILILYDIINALPSPFDTESNTYGRQTVNADLTTVSITPTNTNGLVISGTGVDYNTLYTTIGAGYISDIVYHDKLDNQINTPEATAPSTLAQDGGWAHVYNSSTAALTFSYTEATFAAYPPAPYLGAQFWDSTAVAFKGVTGTTPPQSMVAGRATVNPTAVSIHSGKIQMG